MNFEVCRLPGDKFLIFVEDEGQIARHTIRCSVREAIGLQHKIMTEICRANGHNKVDGYVNDEAGSI